MFGLAPKGRLGGWLRYGLLIGGWGLMASSLMAQNSQQNDRENLGPPEPEVQANVRVLTELLGMPVTSYRGIDLGVVQDVIVDSDWGVAAYVLVRSPEELDIGARLFAVPWTAISTTAISQRLVAVAERSQAVQAAAVGNSRNRVNTLEWGNYIHNVYDQRPYWLLSVYRDAGLPARRGSQWLRTVEDRADLGDTTVVGAPGPGRMVLASHILSADVRGAEQRRLGRIINLMVGMVTGRIRYAALSEPGSDAEAPKFYALPWSVIRFESTGGDFRVRVNLPAERLPYESSFIAGNWPAQADDRFTRRDPLEGAVAMSDGRRFEGAVPTTRPGQ